jgi:predicted AAA+ superfamily ATPase
MHVMLAFLPLDFPHEDFSTPCLVLVSYYCWAPRLHSQITTTVSSSLANSNLSDAVSPDIKGNDLVGRETETTILFDALERVSHGNGKPELVLVGGISGTGKSCLVDKTLNRRTLDEKGGFFIHGKFDQFSEGTDLYV